MKKFKSPAELFEFEQGLFEFEQSFVPEPINQNNVLFWHVPEFLENNSKNYKLTKITASDENEEGNNFRLKRLDKIIEYTNSDIYSEFDKKTENIWLNEPKRDELIEKAEQLLIRCQYNIGYHQAGLYLDYNKFFELLDDKLPFKEVEKIVDNNLFLGNMATFYAILVNNECDFNVCETAKQKYKQTLDLLGDADVHFKLPYEQRIYYDYETDENNKSKLKIFSESEIFDGIYVSYGPQFLYEIVLNKNIELKDNQAELKILNSIDNCSDVTVEIKKRSLNHKEIELKTEKEKYEEDILSLQQKSNSELERQQTRKF